MITANMGLFWSVLGVVGIALVVLCVLLARKLAQDSAAIERQRHVQEQAMHTARTVDVLGQQITLIRSEAREDAERQRAAALQTQTEHLQALQRQTHEALTTMHAQMEVVRRAMGTELHQLRGTVGEQLGQQAKVILEVKGELGSLGEAARNLQALGKDVSSLHDLLRAPKLRGNLGELLLEDILRQILPADAYTMQYRFEGAGEGGNAVIVDSVIRLADKLVPIDSKFPLESFQRMAECNTDEEQTRARKQFLDVVKKHIDAIASKYIRPDMGTYDFALMYCPAENVYYEAMVRQEESAADSIVSYAAQRKVVPVSPNTLYAYLLTIAYGLKGMQIERQAEAIRGELAQFQKKFLQFFKVYEKVGKNLDLAHRHFDDASKKASRLNDRMNVMTGHTISFEEEPLVGDEPLLEDEPVRLVHADG